MTIIYKLNLMSELYLDFDAIITQRKIKFNYFYEKYNRFNR